MTVEALNQTATNGFGGTLNGMSLSDVLQLKNLNRYTGCLTVEFKDKKGIMFSATAISFIQKWMI
jgi:hypothetical protein